MISYAGEGDVLNVGEFVVAHGCNTVGVMGAGIAKQVRAEFPEVYAAYYGACIRGAFRLGSAQRCSDLDRRNSSLERARTIYNLGTQKRPGPDATAWGIFLSFANMFESMLAHDEHRVAIPRIGTGIGALSWTDDVAPAITEAISQVSGEVRVVVYDFTP